MGQHPSNGSSAGEANMTEKASPTLSNTPSASKPTGRHILPVHHDEEGNLRTKGIQPKGESGRSGFHPLHFFKVAWTSASPLSSWVNLLWPFVPAAIALHFAKPEAHVWIFALNYIAMIPAASLLGFAGQEFAKKLPRVIGVLSETALGGVVEIILFMVLIVRDDGNGNLIGVIQAAILGSIMTNLLLCLGCCFIVGGIHHKEQTFHPIISEVGSGILLVAGFGLLVPTAFFTTLHGYIDETSVYTFEKLRQDTLGISHATSIILMIAFAVFIIYSSASHDNIFDQVLEQDEANDRDGERDDARMKFTLTECVIALVIALTCISLHAIFLVFEIPYIVEEQHVPDAFLGFILVPLVEKAAEHLTAIDEAYDNQINFALYHCIGPSIQTALFNAPLVVLVGWGLGIPMDLNFTTFMIICLIMAILVVGNFLRDGSSNYLEGSLLVVVYVIIAVTTFYYPNPDQISTNAIADSTR